MEALCCGLRVVASTVGGLPEIVEPGLGELVPPGDADAVAAAIRRQLALPPLTESCRRGIAARFAWSTVFSAYRDVWSQVYA
jgi:glycosyltransferase involved in cell wall biosynthesis